MLYARKVTDLPPAETFVILTYSPGLILQRSPIHGSYPSNEPMLLQAKLQSAALAVIGPAALLGGINRIGHAQSGIVLATIHVRAGEPRGLSLAHGSITAVTKLSSVRARKRLEPLVTALAARPGTQDLARMARQVSSAPV